MANRFHLEKWLEGGVEVVLCCTLAYFMGGGVARVCAHQLCSPGGYSLQESSRDYRED